MYGNLKTAYRHLPTNTYKTTQRALDKFLDTCDKLGIKDMQFVIAVDHSTQRFFPIAMPDADQVPLAIMLAHNGVVVVRL